LWILLQAAEWYGGEASARAATKESFGIRRVSKDDWFRGGEVLNERLFFFSKFWGAGR
jgi:hypothetical protein